MKSSRQGLTRQVALPHSFDSFFSFPVRKSGYSGTAIYTRRNVVVPLKAEEGLTGLIQPKSPLTIEEKISRRYPPQLDHIEEEDQIDWKDLDGEGRAVVVDLGLFVLINTYCPNDGTGTEERERFKMEYHRLLEARVNGLINEGKQVMVVGDLNACAAIEDHCEGQLMVERGQAEGLEGEEGFWGKEYRRWIRDWLVKDDANGGSMVDIVRKFWPGRKGMYTCWNTKISARETNYGTRIDFILITAGLVPWIKAADIQPQLKGSDHCPVFVDFHDEITDSRGATVKLCDVLGSSPTDSGPAEAPRLAAKNWDELKQKPLAAFFGKKSHAPESSQSPPTMSISSRQQSQVFEFSSSSASPMAALDPRPMASTAPSSTSEGNPPDGLPTSSMAQTSQKRKLVPESPDSSAKKSKVSQIQKKEKKKEMAKTMGQTTLAGFFSQPKASTSKSTSASSSKLKSTKSFGRVDENMLVTNKNGPENIETESFVVDEDADYQYALLLSQSEDGLPNSSQDSTSGQKLQSEKDQKKKQAWNTLLAPTQVPICLVHREPAKEFTVNKPGPNKGKKFFICSR